MNYLRKQSIIDSIEYTKDKGELWLIGDDSDFGYAEEFSKKNEHVKYLGVQKNMTYFYNISDVTVGLYLGRTLIEGVLSGNDCIGYNIDKKGNVLSVVDVNDIHDGNEFDVKSIVKSYLEVYIKHFNNN